MLSASCLNALLAQLRALIQSSLNIQQTLQSVWYRALQPLAWHLFLTASSASTREPNGKLTVQFLRQWDRKHDGVGQVLESPWEAIRKEVLTAVDHFGLETFSALDLIYLNVV